jgi:hypothetical protein
MTHPITLPTTHGANSVAGLQTEYPFTLPRGYVDGRGRVRRAGAMRLATARDEIAPQADPRVRSNPAYLTVLLLARTVVRLDGVDDVDTDVVEALFAADLAYLQDLYRQINQRATATEPASCPECGHEFEVGLAGGSVGE